MTTNITTAEDYLAQLGIKLPASILVPRECQRQPS